MIILYIQKEERYLYTVKIFNNLLIYFILFYFIQLLDQLINFYTYVENFEKCKVPLNEILKIMDKSKFKYDIDVTPVNHVVYYIIALIYLLKDTESINLSKAITYFANILIIIYRYPEKFANIPPSFYDKIFYLMEAIRLNYGEVILVLSENRDSISKAGKEDLDKKEKNQNLETIFTLIENTVIYLDEIIAKYDTEKTLNLSPSGGSSSLADSMVTLDRYYKFLKNPNFGQFNFINEICDKYKEENLNVKYSSDHSIKEIDIIKIAAEKMLLKFGIIIKDLVDCRKITDKIIMEGLNGFLHIDNDELILYSIHRFSARDSKHIIYEGN
jgi:hypothetical protein